MSGEAKSTTNHDEIRKWAEERGGVPTTAKQMEKDKEPGVLRIHFPGYSDEEERFEEIGWDEFFKKFEESQLEFIYQDDSKSGEKSYFCKLISRTPS